jgi:hypothetical protein
VVDAAASAPQDRHMTHRNPSLFDVLLLATVAGALATLLGGYTYATGDQVEQMPMILRALDSNYLSNDLFASSEAPVRANYVSLVALLTDPAPLPVVVFCLALLTNILIATITGLCARDLFDRSNEAGMLAIAITMSVATFGLGSSREVYRTLLTPNGLVLPLGFLSLWAGFRGYPILCVVSAGSASLIHPTFGLETGAIAFGASILAELLAAPKQRDTRHRRDFASRAGAALIFAFFGVFWARHYLSMEHLASDRLVDIYVHFRSPHHLVPSSFDNMEWLEATCFLLATGIGWYWWQQRVDVPRRLVVWTPIFIGIILLLCLGGYVFVEMIPSAIWVAAQPYRMPFLLKWFGLMFAGGAAASLLSRHRETEDRFDAYVLLLGVLSPITMGLTHALKLGRRWSQERIPLVGTWLGSGPTLLATAGALIALGPGLQPVFRFLTLTFMALTLMSQANRWLSRLFVVGLTLLLILLLFLGHGYLPSGADDVLDKIRPAITPGDLTGDEVAVARWARECSPRDALFLAPPLFGQFRVTAERALLVDFKLFPGHLADEWQRRLFDAYGVPRERGFPGAQEMDEMYRSIDDARLQSLQSKYDIDFAVLYRETNTRLPVVYQNETYMVVRLSDPPVQIPSLPCPSCHSSFLVDRQHRQVHHSAGSGRDQEIKTARSL